MANTTNQSENPNGIFSSADEYYRSPRPSIRPYASPTYSFIIPVMNEEATLEELTMGIFANVPDADATEIIFIDDGSTDSSWTVVQALADLYPNNIRGLRFRCNRGKANALQTGFGAAQGEIIFTMDADLQDDPNEIPRFLEKLEEGYDLISGWKAVRHDPWHKVLPSRIFNRMLSYFSRVKLHDHNCGFKCYRRDVAKSIHLFGELHRMVPALAGMNGFRVTEIVVEHHARKCGQSKYGIERFIRGFSDMLTIGFLRVYRERPSHFTNAWAVVYGAIAFAIAAGGLYHGPTTLAGLICFLAAVCFIGMAGACMIAGLMSELIIRQNREKDARTFVNRDTRSELDLTQLKQHKSEQESSVSSYELATTS